MNKEFLNYWALDRKGETEAVLFCLIEERVKALFIEWFELEIEFMQAESKYIDGRSTYKVIVTNPEKIFRLNNFCIATDKEIDKKQILN